MATALALMEHGDDSCGCGHGILVGDW